MGFSQVRAQGFFPCTARARTHRGQHVRAWEAGWWYTRGGRVVVYTRVVYTSLYTRVCIAQYTPVRRAQYTPVRRAQYTPVSLLVVK